MMGTTRETVSRLFSEFKKKQLLQLKRATLIIRNKPGSKIGAFLSAYLYLQASS